ncbi:MAG: excinuclease ABC subunit UvrC [Acidimicrobiales bacterium]
MISRPPAGTIPDGPGSYQFYDADGRVIYVGKAASLRQRLSSYFADPATLAPRTAQMVATAERVEWIQVRNEVEALMLEFNLIKTHRPRFNIRLRDDKSYPYLAITVSDEWPRPTVMRGAKRKGVKYFGPYAHAYAIRETLDLLLRSFPVRTCTDHKFNRHQKLGRPCLLFHIEKCAAPCVGEISKPDHDRLVGELVDFLAGDTQTIVRRLEAEMAAAADVLEFERAARLRDRLSSVGKAIERQQMVTERSEDLDVFGLAEDELEAAVTVFYVRRGRVMGRKGFIVDKVEDLDRPGLISQVLEQHYADEHTEVPREILVPDLPDDADVLTQWLSLRRTAAVAMEYPGGSRAVRATRNVTVRVPQRGDKRVLQETVTRNASEEFTRHRLRRASDHNSRARALNALQDALDLPEAPLRIECFDMSHIQGSDYVGSMVVMEDGLPKKSDYRRFKVATVGQNDDYAAMGEVLTRRLGALLEEREKPVAERSRRFSYPPQLLVVDGGKGQLGVAVRVLEDLGLDTEIPVVGLAKQFEEVFVPGHSEPIRIPRQSEALYLLQRVRDEAHRFAIAYHRQLRGKRMTRSILDDVAGLGPTRQARLTKELGGLAGVKRAELDDLEALRWLPNAVARSVYDRLHGPPGPGEGRTSRISDRTNRSTRAPDLLDGRAGAAADPIEREGPNE